MSASEQDLSTLWRAIDGHLARGRASRPRHQSDALLDLDRLPVCDDLPLLARLGRAVAGWEGRLVLRVPDDTLAPEVRVGDRLMIDPEIAPGDGQLVVAFAAGALTVRRLRVRADRNWLEAGTLAPIWLGPLVAILGRVVELRRAV
jgi:hypothetical protein